MFNTDHTNFVVADTTAPLNHFRKNGYYTVGNKIFLHRIYALQESTKTNQEIKFHYCDEVFRQLDWRSPTGVPIMELYRMRAQQLREKYSYLICNWSGGVDSTNMIESFINNNIKLDEIVVAWPVKYLEGRYKVSRNPAGENFMSEWELAIKPKLKWLETEHPEIKLTIADYSDELGKEEYEYDTVIYTAKHGYISIKKFRAMDRILEDRQEKYKSAAAVTGINPVQCQIVNDYLAVTFVDDLCNAGPKSDYLPNGWTRNIEFFYWTPDLPEIMKEQAHLYLQYANQHPECRYIFDRLELQPDRTLKFISVGHVEDKRSLAKKLFYPNWDNAIFQANKAKNHVGRCEWYSWYYNNSHADRSIDSWQSALGCHNRLIDPKYYTMVDNEIGNYQLIATNPYVVGKLTSV